MPLRNYSPFEDINPKVNMDVNPYIKEIVEAAKNKTLPVVYGPFLKGLAGKWSDFLKENGLYGESSRKTGSGNWMPPRTCS